MSAALSDTRPSPSLVSGRVQFSTKDLAERVPGQVVQEHDVPGDLEAGQVPARVSVDLFGGQPASLSGYDEGHRSLAEVRILGAGHGDVRDVRVIAEHLFDLAWIYVLASRDDHVVLACVDEQAALAVEVAQVARGQHAVDAAPSGRVVGVS